MDGFDSQVARRVSKAIQEAIDTEKEHYAAGFVKTLEDLKYRTGRLKGLSDALELMKEVEKDLAKS